MLKTWWAAVLAGALFFLAADSPRRLAAFRATTTQGEIGRPTTPELSTLAGSLQAGDGPRRTP